MIEHFRNDKSTIFSIVPLPINESKPGLYPGEFHIPACKNESTPSILTISASEHLMEVADSKPVRIVTPSFQIAKSIVDDYFDGQLHTRPDARPGIAWIQGNLENSDLFLKYKQVYEDMKANQKRWFLLIAKETDNDWNRYHTHKVVSEQSRLAAHALGLTPEWLAADITALDMLVCPACSTKNPMENAICTTCRCVINKAKYETLSFAKG